MFCSNCGKQVGNEAKFCSYCGTKIVSSETGSLNKRKNEPQKKSIAYTIAFNERIIFSYEMRKYIEICSIFEKNAAGLYKNFKEYINTVSNFNDLYGKAYDKFLNEFNTQLGKGQEILIAHGVDIYSLDMLKKEIWDSLEGSNGWRYLQNYYEPKRKLEEFVDETNQKRNVQRSNRSYWMGGGHGIKGALVGSMKADMLNIGTGALRKIGDSIVDSGDRKKAKQYMDIICQEGKAGTNLAAALYFFVCDMGHYIHSILVEKDVLDPVNFPYTSEEIEAKATNIYDCYCKGQYNRKQAIQKLCSCISVYPFDFVPINYIYMIDSSSERTLLLLTEDLGTKEEWLLSKKQIDDKKRENV